jgi:perosamine synthetase
MSAPLAIDGGKPVRTNLLPYGRQEIDADDRKAILDVLGSAWLTTGPMVSEFETMLAQRVGAKDAVAVSNGTAALHTAYYAIGLKAGDEIIVPTMTFAATANAALFLGATPVFADVDPETLLMDPKSVESKLSSKTKAIAAVDYAGQPCDYPRLAEIAKRRSIALVADGSHALGASLDGKPVGSLADATTFSFHPVKPITSAEGGMVVTQNPDWATRARQFRNHGMTSDFRQREQKGSWYYEIADLGFNYRLSDLHCALGISQLKRLDRLTARRQAIASRYRKAMEKMTLARPLVERPGVSHAYHLFVIRLNLKNLRADRGAIFAALRAEGIGVNVHYIPVHLQPLYQNRLGTKPGQYPIAEAAYEDILTLPLFPQMSDADADDVMAALDKVLTAYAAHV